MKKNVWLIPIMVLMTTLAFTACPSAPTIPTPGNGSFDPDALEDGRIVGDFFTRSPTLNLVVPVAPYGVLRASYVQALPANDPGTTYVLYLVEGNLNRIDDIVQAAATSIPITVAEFQLQTLEGLNEDMPHSAVLVAINGASRAYSAVRQASTISGFVWATPAQEEQFRGWLVSHGSPNDPVTNRNAQGGRTFFIDAARGNDLNDGLHPQRAFRTFRVINNDIFLGPGDQVLLEANSVWNGIPVNINNFRAQAAMRGNGGMLAIRSNVGGGASGNPIIIDLYEMRPNPTGSGLMGFFSANQRPIINGNGTPALDTTCPRFPYSQSAAVEVINMSYVHVRNLQVTNSFDFHRIAEDITWRDVHWLKWRFENPYVTPSMDQRLRDGVPKVLWGFMLGDERAGHVARGFLIENNYVHDVQSFHRNGRNFASDWLTNTYFGFPAMNPGKRGGGFMIALSDSTMIHNIGRRLGYCGLHTYDDSWPNMENRNMRFIGNYFEDVTGDAMVIGTLRGGPTEWNIVESNIAIRPGATMTSAHANFAAIFTYYAEWTLFQYNEVFGMMYGYQDSQAWDMDDVSDQNVFQYNYSHHNSGGTLLVIMSANGVFRYNISANDGIGVRGLRRVQEGPGPLGAAGSVLGRPYRPINTAAPCYTDFYGSSLFLLHDRSNVPSPQHPLIYNNTFFVGPGHTVGLVGHLDTRDRNTYIRFFNNILLKAGEGRIILSWGEGADGGHTGGFITNPTGFANNLLWAYLDDPNVPNPHGITNGTAGLSALLGPLNEATGMFAGLNGNRWFNPRLQIQEPGMFEVLRRQYDTEFHDRPQNNNNPARLGLYTSRHRLRGRASLFKPVDQAAADALQFGRLITGTPGCPLVDGAWNDGLFLMDKGRPLTGDRPFIVVDSQFGIPAPGEIRDFFGDPITYPPAVGAAQRPFQGSGFQPDPLLDEWRFITDPFGN